MNLKTGSIICNGQLQIARRLGQGPFGITYLALDLPTSRIVVVKELYVQFVCTREDDGTGVRVIQDSKKEYFERLIGRVEAMCKTLKQASSPHMVTINDVKRWGNTLYVVEDYIAGDSLDNYLRKNFLTEEQAIDYTSGIGKALNHIHQQGIYHLAIEPRNIRLTHQNEVVLVGFASAKYPDRNDTSGLDVMKVSPYAPLEVVSMGAQNATPASDVYSLATTLYTMLTRLNPPSANDLLCDGFPLKELQRKNVSEQVIEALQSAMTASRLSRPQSIDEFLEGLGVIVTTDNGLDDDERKTIDDETLNIEQLNVEQLNDETLNVEPTVSLNDEIEQNNAFTDKKNVQKKTHRTHASRYTVIRNIISQAQEEPDTIEKARSLFRQCFDPLDELVQKYGEDNEELQEVADEAADAIMNKLHAPLLELSLDYEMECEAEKRDTYQNACREANLVVLNLTTLPVSHDFIDSKLLPYSTSLKHLSEADLPTSSKPFWKR